MNETVKTITDALKPLAEKLDQGAAHIYSVYVKQAVVTGYMDIIGAMGGLVAVITAAVLFKMAIPQFKDEDGWEAAATFTIVGVFLMFAGVVAVGACLTDSIGHFLNPEYYALQNILNAVKK